MMTSSYYEGLIENAITALLDACKLAMEKTVDVETSRS